MRKLIPALLAAAVLVVAVLALTGGDDDKYVVYVKANDAGGVLNNYNVKIGEVAAGKITDISLDNQDNAVLKMELDKGAYPIGAGASAAIRPVNLLGEKYVDLNPGDLTKPQPSGVTVQPKDTTVPVELDDALNTLDGTTRDMMRILINEAGLAMAGRGADFNRTLSDLPPAIDAAKRVVSQVDQENAKLKALVVQGDRVLAEVNPKSKELGDLVASAADALETAAQRRDKLGQTLQNAPGALNNLRGTLVKLQAASAQLSPAADDLKDTAPALDTTLKRLPQFAEDASGTLAELKKASPTLSRLGRQSTPTLRLLRPTANHLAAFTGDLQPILNTLDQDGGTKALLGFVNGWESTTSQRDALGHVFRLRLTLDSSAVTGLLQRGGLGGLTGPTPAQNEKQPPPPTKRKAAPPAEAPAAPAEDKKPAPSLLPKSATDLLKPLADQLGKTLKDVTGTVTGLLGSGEKGGGLLGGLTGGKKSDPQPSSGGNDASKLLNYLLGP